MISMGMLRDLWAYRGFIKGAVRREFQSRYLRTQFGVFWVIAHPLAMITIYTLIFAELLRPTLAGHDTPYAFSIYLCAGVLTWGLFAETLGRGVSIFVDNAGLLKKVSFPKLCLPVIVVLSSWLHFTIVIGVFIAVLLVIGQFPGWVVLWAIPIVLLQTGLAIGLGILLATINTFYRDVGQAVGVILQFWFWLTPIVYPVTILPEPVSRAIELNPVWPIIRAHQTIFLEQTMPDWPHLVYPAVLTVILLFVGMYAFHRLQGEIVDEL
ncbi:MAG TPA: ABC transporter permease [Rhodocyclaceae bacterium]|nr:ABC transporter permease [Rhodocyclaceae bacterium]